jgi:hypothetical protein
LLFATGQWRRLVPTSWAVLPAAWHALASYVSLRPPHEDAFVRYNPLQQLTYFLVVFVLAPLTIMTGAAMSPAIDARLPWYPRIFGGRQAARSIHFLLMAAWVAFTCVHVALVACTGLVRNMNHIVLGADDERLRGVALGMVGVVPVLAANVILVDIERRGRPSPGIGTFFTNTSSMRRPRETRTSRSSASSKRRGGPSP